MAVHRIGVFVLLACALSTAPFGSMEQGTPAAAHAVAGAKALSWATPGPVKARTQVDIRWAVELRLDGLSTPPHAATRLVTTSLSRATGAMAGAPYTKSESGPRLTYRATAPPPQHAS
jgi:hypothetical protein